jgi:hypothetical protein
LNFISGGRTLEASITTAPDDSCFSNAVHSKDPAAAMPPAPRAAREQLEHLYSFPNTPRTLAAGRRLQEACTICIILFE